VQISLRIVICLRFDRLPEGTEGKFWKAIFQWKWSAKHVMEAATSFASIVKEKGLLQLRLEAVG